MIEKIRGFISLKDATQKDIDLINSYLKLKNEVRIEKDNDITIVDFVSQYDSNISEEKINELLEKLEDKIVDYEIILYSLYENGSTDLRAYFTNIIRCPYCGSEMEDDEDGFALVCSNRMCRYRILKPMGGE